MRRPRFLAHLRAWWGHWFWLPCPSCGRKFAGFEWQPFADPDGEPEHAHTIPVGLPPDMRGQGICPICTEAGVGDRAWAGVWAFTPEAFERWEAARG